MKLAGSILLILSGFLWGWAKAGELRRRERLLMEWQSFLQALKTGIRYSARPLGELIRKESASFCREAANGPDFAYDPRQALARAGEALFTHPADRGLFREFTLGLGASDAEGQLRHIGLYEARVEQALQEARAEREKRGRLMICLGLFGGLTACLVLL